jgi:hypothetical protein
MSYYPPRNYTDDFGDNYTLESWHYSNDYRLAIVEYRSDYDDLITVKFETGLQWVDDDL